MSETPGVVLKSKFSMPTSKEYKEYVDYIDRDESKIKQRLNINRESSNLQEFNVFHSYMDYMGNEEKTSALFTNDHVYLNDEQKNELKNVFKIGEQNGSPMWQDVISFDNNWLGKQGIYDSKTGELDEIKIQNAVREAVNEMLKLEKMGDTAVWSAAIHYNTDNIHVHVATVEPFPTRQKKKIFNNETKEWELQYRAKRKQGTLNKMKSKIANTILDRSNERNRINEIIRGAVQDKKEIDVDLSSYRKTKWLFLKAIIHLPEDRRQWKYGYHSIDGARPYIDEIVDVYLNKYHKNEMKELENLLDAEVEVMKEMYGKGSHYEQYKKTKLDDLRKRMGNAVLSEMKVYVNRTNKNYNTGFQWKQKGELTRAIHRLSYRLRKTYQDYQKDRNLEEYDRMLDGYER